MSNDLVPIALSEFSVRPTVANESVLPSLVERAGGAARFAWDEFFYAEHHNPHTQKAYQRAVRRFLGWAEGQGVELAAITPGMVGQYLVGLGGSPAKRNQHLAALRGFFDRLVNRHVCILNPAASVRGVKDQVIEGKTPEITVEHARTLLASIDTGNVVGLRDRAILGTLAYTACRGGAVAKLRLGDFQDDGQQYVLRFQEKGGKSREIPVRHDLEGFILAYVEAAGIGGDAKDTPLFRMGNGRTTEAVGHGHDVEADLRAGQAAAERCRAAVAAVAALLPGDGDHRPADAGHSARGRAVPGRARGAANDRALRPAAEEGDAEHRGADFDLAR